jgi:regulator of cell morphogenesis and NO signaling
MYQTAFLKVSPKTRISEIVLNNPYISLLLEHFSIGLPCQEHTVETICSENNINPELFITIINLYNGVNNKTENKFLFADIISIINYLRNSHQYYTVEIYPSILEIIRQMSASENQKEMSIVESFFNNYFTEVTEHLNYENDIVFPYIIELYENSGDVKKRLLSYNHSVAEYKKHHSDIEEKLSDLKNLLIKYLPQQNDQPLRRKLILSLFELEYDLKIHSRIEDSILIPLAARLESIKSDPE